MSQDRWTASRASHLLVARWSFALGLALLVLGATAIVGLGQAERTPRVDDSLPEGFGSTRAAGCENDKDDIGYSARIGADQQYGNIVIGVVGEFGKSEIRDSVTAYSSTPANYVFNREIDWEASIRGRAGYAAECPNVGRFLQNLSFTLDMENQIMSAILDEGKEPGPAAKDWLKAHPEAAAPWLEGVTTFDGGDAQAALSEALDD